MGDCKAGNVVFDNTKAQVSVIEGQDIESRLEVVDADRDGTVDIIFTGEKAEITREDARRFLAGFDCGSSAPNTPIAPKTKIQEAKSLFDCNRQVLMAEIAAFKKSLREGTVTIERVGIGYGIMRRQVFYKEKMPKAGRKGLNLKWLMES